MLIRQYIVHKIKLIFRMRYAAAIAVSLAFHAIVFASAYVFINKGYFSNETKLPYGNTTTIAVSFEPLQVLDESSTKTTETFLEEQKDSTSTKKKIATKPKKSIQKGVKEGSSLSHETKNTYSSLTSLKMISKLNACSENTSPEYPEDERQFGNEAKCSFALKIGDQGQVISVIDISKQLDLPNCGQSFIDSALKTLSKWRFQVPANNFNWNLEPYKVDITFKLQD